MVIPAGKFLSGAVFLKPGVNLHLDEGAVLLGSTNIQDYPSMPTRVEGHTQVWRPALVNADKCDHLRITGAGAIQGGGKPFWDAFHTRRNADKKTKNLDVERPRNLFIQNSNDISITGVSLRDSGFWNMHLYRCQDVTVEKVDIRSPLGAPSTDGIDVDSCQRVTIHACHISVSDDNIALKGTKGPFAENDKDSPAVEHVRISDCIFGLGYGALTLGSEACYVRDVVMDHCQMDGSCPQNCILRLKLRLDTPQHYSDIHVHDVSISGRGSMVNMLAWTQYFDLKGQAAPKQQVENVSMENITGSTTSFGRIEATAASSIRGLTLKNIALTVTDPAVVIRNVEDLREENVKINGSPMITTPAGSPAR